MDWQSLVKTVAPILGTALGGPFGGMAVQAIGSVFGLSQATTDTVKAAIAGATPEQMLALKQADQDFQLKMAALGFENTQKLEELNLQYAQTDAADRDSARKREETVKDRTPAHLAYMIIGGFFAVSVAQLVALMGYGQEVAKIPSQGWLLIGNISGYLAAEAKAAAAYYFGTSAASEKKTDLLAKAQPIDQ